ncbi:MAG: type II toxin-antitoxin system RelE/ParE family toxin [Thermoguttaceae bacterium]
MEIRVLESAQDDLRAGYRFYEGQAAGLGDYFLDCLQADIRSLLIYAGVHAKADGFFRMLAKRFPYAVYYLIEEDRVDIYAILDCRRDPSWIDSRLSRSRTSR